MVTLEEATQQIEEAETQLGEQRERVGEQREEFISITKFQPLTLQRQLELGRIVGVGGVQQTFQRIRQAKIRARQEFLPQFEEAEVQFEEVGKQITEQKERIRVAKIEESEALRFQDIISRIARGRPIPPGTTPFEVARAEELIKPFISRSVREVQAEKALRELEQRPISTFEQARILSEALPPEGAIIFKPGEVGLKEGEFGFLPSAEVRIPTGKEILDIALPPISPETLTPTGQKLRKVGVDIRTSLEKATQKFETFLEKGQRVQKPVGVELFGTQFLTGIATSPLTLARFGVGLVTDPFETGKEFVGGLADIPTEIRADPFGASGRLGGELVGQFFIFRGGARLRGRAKAPKVEVSKFEVSKGIPKTPFARTFPETFDIIKFKEPTGISKIALERIQAKRPITFEFDPVVLREIDFAKSVQEARLKAGADIIKIDKLGIPRIIEVLKPKKGFRPEELTFEFEEPLVKRFDIIKDPLAKKSPKAFRPEEVTFEFEKPLVQRFDILEQPKKAKPKRKPKKAKPLQFDFTGQLKRDLKFEFKQPQRFDVIEQQQVLKPQKQKVVPKQKDIIIDLDQLKFLEPKVKAKVKPKRPRLETRTPDLDLIGIPRSVGGLGLTIAQLEVFGRARTAQQIQQARQTQVQLIDQSLLGRELGRTRFAEQQTLEAELLRTQPLRTRTLELQAVKQDVLFLPIFRQRQLSALRVETLQIPKISQLTEQAFDVLQIPKQITRQRVRERAIFDLEFAPLIPKGLIRRRDFDKLRKKPKKAKRRPKVKTPIRPSFTGIVLEIEAPAIESPRLGITPFQIRGLETGFDISRRKKKKKVKKKKKK